MAVEFTFIVLEKKFRSDPAFVQVFLTALREVSEELRAEKTTTLTTALVKERGGHLRDEEVMDTHIEVLPNFAPTFAKIGPEKLVESIDAIIETLEKGQTNPSNYTTAAAKLMKLQSNEKFYRHKVIQGALA